MTLATMKPKLDASMIKSIQYNAPHLTHCLVNRTVVKRPLSEAIISPPRKRQRSAVTLKKVRFSLESTEYPSAASATYSSTQDRWLTIEEYASLRNETKAILMLYASVGGRLEELGEGVCLRGLENTILVTMHGADRYRSRKLVHRIVQEQGILKAVFGSADPDYLRDRYVELSRPALEKALTLANVDAVDLEEER